MPLRYLLIISCFLWVPVSAASAEENVDLQAITRIREEGFTRSKVMETAGYLCDSIGPRLTASPNLKKALDWSQEQLKSLGFANVHLESWGPFGRGWSYQYGRVCMLSPDQTPLMAYPKAWSRGTEGAVRAKAIKVNLETEADFSKYRGKLKGLFVLNGNVHELKVHDKPDLNRYSQQQLEDLFRYSILPVRKPEDREAFLKRRTFQRELRKFLMEEQALAFFEASSDDHAIFVSRGGAYKPDEPAGIPSLVLATEHYNRLVRLLDRKTDVELEVDVQAKFHDQDNMSYNLIAEIPGMDRKEEVVMFGGHLDSWHAGTGATDNASGVSVAMEALRILKALDLKPRRTIRLALWSGEEQGLLGSSAYVSSHFASRPEPKDPEEKDMPVSFRKEPGPLSFKPEYRNLSAYFNLDNGTGKIRGIYVQGNAAVRPIFEAWIKPLEDLKMTTVTLRNTGSTDHVPFDAVGLPGFQFIQDQVEYSSRTWHSNMDVFDRLQPEDLMQAAVVMATFVYHAAMRDELLPRKTLTAEILSGNLGRPASSKSLESK